MTLRLCRDVYHCRLSELREEKLADVLAHLACISVENQVERVRRGGK